MRDIKFRGISVETGRMVFGDLVQCQTKMVYIKEVGYIPTKSVPAERFIEVKPETVGQFTGLKDSDEIDVFEGDIVEFTFWWFDGNEAESNLTGEIVYSEGNMSFQLKGIKNKEWEEFTGHSGDDYLTPFSELNFEEADFRVIGNIHTKENK